MKDRLDSAHMVNQATSTRRTHLRGECERQPHEFRTLRLCVRTRGALDFAALIGALLSNRFEFCGAGCRTAHFAKTFTGRGVSVKREILADTIKCPPPMSRLRVSAISFLNTAPLMWDFEHAPQKVRLAQSFKVHYTLPAACADELARGTSDIGIIPVSAYASIPGLQVIPDIAIAAKGAVRSILLVCRKPLESVRTVALDTSSRTSVALTKVLFKIRWNKTPAFSSHAPDLNAML